MEFKAFHNYGIQLTFSLITYIPASRLLAVLFLCMLSIAFCYLFMWLNLLRTRSPALCPFFLSKAQFTHYRLHETSFSQPLRIHGSFTSLSRHLFSYFLCSIFILLIFVFSLVSTDLTSPT